MSTAAAKVTAASTILVDLNRVISGARHPVYRAWALAISWQAKPDLCPTNVVSCTLPQTEWRTALAAVLFHEPRILYSDDDGILTSCYDTARSEGTMADEKGA